MTAVVCKDAALGVADRPSPVPGNGQVLLDVHRCGICGSDLHARHHADELAEVVTEAGYDGIMRSGEEVVFGHEFSGIVAEHGVGGGSLATGTPVVAVPLLRRSEGVHGIGLSTLAPGAYAGEVAALTEPG